MKSKAIALVMVMLGLIVGVATAQSTEPMKFRTPFAFVVNDRAVPAGEYTVGVMSMTGVLSFRSADGTVNVLVNSTPLQGPATEDRFRLVFHRYGAQYYVSEIWAPGYRTGRTVMQTPAELELAKSTTQQHVTLYADAWKF